MSFGTGLIRDEEGEKSGGEQAKSGGEEDKSGGEEEEEKKKMKTGLTSDEDSDASDGKAKKKQTMNDDLKTGLTSRYE